MDELHQRAEQARTAARHVRARSQELRHGGGRKLPPGSPPLSPREREVLELLAAGLPNKAIALQLGIAVNTVSYYLAQVYRKLRVHSRVDAATAYRRMLASPREPGSAET